jgi:hypothetical protein
MAWRTDRNDACTGAVYKVESKKSKVGEGELRREEEGVVGIGQVGSKEPHCFQVA